MGNAVLHFLVHFGVGEAVVMIVLEGNENRVPTERCGALRVQCDFAGCSALKQGDLFTAKKKKKATRDAQSKKARGYIK